MLNLPSTHSNTSREGKEGEKKKVIGGMIGRSRKREKRKR